MGQKNDTKKRSEELVEKQSRKNETKGCRKEKRHWRRGIKETSNRLKVLIEGGGRNGKKRCCAVTPTPLWFRLVWFQKKRAEERVKVFKTVRPLFCSRRRVTGVGLYWLNVVTLGIAYKYLSFFHVVITFYIITRVEINCSTLSNCYSEYTDKTHV